MDWSLKLKDPFSIDKNMPNVKSVMLFIIFVFGSGPSEVCCHWPRWPTRFQNLTQWSYPSQGGHGTGKTGNLVLTFSRQGKRREFYFDTGKNFETQGKYFFVTQGKN